MTDSARASAQTTAKRSVGRPRRLTLNQILDAALELGLEDLTMTQLAQHIGVSVTVLYGYVANRDYLLKAAIARAALNHEFPEDTGQHWSDYVAAYAGVLHDLLTADSQLVSSFMQGGLGAHTQVEQAESWMQALLKRGFPPEQAASLYRAVGQLIIGCAVARLHAKALEADGTSQSEQFHLAVQARADELQTLRQHLPALLEPAYGNWEEPLLWQLRGVAALRGETAPSDSWLGVWSQKVDAASTNKKSARTKVGAKRAASKTR